MKISQEMITEWEAKLAALAPLPDYVSIEFVSDSEELKDYAKCAMQHFGLVLREVVKLRDAVADLEMRGPSF